MNDELTIYSCLIHDYYRVVITKCYPSRASKTIDQNTDVQA